MPSWDAYRLPMSSGRVTKGVRSTGPHRQVPGDPAGPSGGVPTAPPAKRSRLDAGSSMAAATLEFRHLPLLTSRSLSLSYPEQVSIDGCELLTEWLLEPGQLAQMRRWMRVRVDLGPCARCGLDERSPESMHTTPAVAVCDVCQHLMCWACRETAVDIGGPCAGCGAAVVCVDCMLQVQARGFIVGRPAHGMSMIDVHRVMRQRYWCGVCQ